MKPNHLLFALVAGAFVRAAAAPLTEPTAVQTQPDLNAPVLSILNPGTEPVAAAGPTESLPAGWTAVMVTGPFDGYVRNADLTKQLEVKPGTSIRVAPKADAGVLAVFAAGDKAPITGLHGAWTQVRLEKNLVGYIHVGAAAAAAPIPAMTPATPPAPPPAPPAPGSAAVTPPPDGGPVPAPVGHAYDSGGDTSALPRTFEGTFVSTHHAFSPRRPYDWQVNDANGQRYAYLDITHLLLTDQIENYAGHEVTVFGTARPVPGTKDLVIQIESLRLK